MRRILVSGLALAVLAVVAFVLPTLGLSAEDAAKDVKTVKGKVAVTKNDAGTVTDITITSRKKAGSETIHVKLDDNGRKLADLDTKFVAAKGTIQETGRDKDVVKTITVLEFAEYTPKNKTPAPK